MLLTTSLKYFQRLPYYKNVVYKHRELPAPSNFFILIVSFTCLFIMFRKSCGFSVLKTLQILFYPWDYLYVASFTEFLSR